MDNFHSANNPKPSRRRFLKMAGASALTLARSNTIALGDETSTARKSPSGIDAIVVGGGFAGVTATRELAREG